MATALNVGTKVGTVAGRLGAFAWSTTCRVASATGDLGEGFIAGADTGWDEQMVLEERKVAAATAKKNALRAQIAAVREQQALIGAAPAPDIAALVAAAVAQALAKPAKARA